MKTKISLLCMLLLFFSCTNDKQKQIIEKRNAVKELFQLIPSWKTKKHEIGKAYHLIDSLNKNVTVYEYDSTLYYLKFSADSLKYFNDFKILADSSTKIKSVFKEYTSWRDSINGYLLLDYSLYLNPRKANGYIFEISKRNQE